MHVEHVLINLLGAHLATEEARGGEVATVNSISPLPSPMYQCGLHCGAYLTSTYCSVVADDIGLQLRSLLAEQAHGQLPLGPFSQALITEIFTHQAWYSCIS